MAAIGHASLYMTAEAANERARPEEHRGPIKVHSHLRKRKKKAHQEIKKECGRWVERWSRQQVVRVQERKKKEHAISTVISQSGGSSGAFMTH